MIDIKRLRHDPEACRAALARRLDASLDATFDQLLELERRRREAVATVERVRAERNVASEQVARLKQSGGDATALLASLKQSAEAGKALEAETSALEAELAAAVLALPNFPHGDAPDGGAESNRVVREWGERTDRASLQPHWEIGERLGLFDLARGASVSGSGFPIFVGVGARLVRALANFMLDLHTGAHGYTEVAPPYLVTRESMVGTGQLPKFESELYRTADDDLFLIPTAEVPVTNLHRGEMLDASQLPLAYAAWTPCFRREAGAHGKDTRGLIRVHQFDKVELVRLVNPTESDAEHQRITGHAEAVLQRLGLPYRVLELAAGDTGFAAARTYDLEVWAPGLNTWLEVSSASTFTDFQARRANIRYRPAGGGKPEFVHTLNASGLAFPRTIIALLEHGQQPDGSVTIPEALVPYLGMERIGPGG